MAVVDPNRVAATLAPGAPSQPSLTQHLGQVQAVHMEQWGKLQEAHARLSAVRGVMDQLTGMGDMVTPEDVVKGAGNLVAAGMSAPAIAGLLADMPEQPQALQEWLKQQDAGVRQREAELEQAKAGVGHALAVSSLKLLMGLGAENMQRQMSQIAGAGGELAAKPRKRGANSPPAPATNILTEGSSDAD